MKQIDIPVVSVEQMPIPELLCRAVDHYNRHLSKRKGYGIAWTPTTVRSPQWRLDRVAVNYIRHQLTSYDEVLARLLEEGTARLAVKQLQRHVLALIAVAYPEFAAECLRQAKLRGIRLGQVAARSHTEPLRLS